MSQNNRRAKRGVPFTNNTAKTEHTKLRAVIEYFINHYRYLDGDKRLQKLVFYTDYRYYQEHGEQLTGADYTPYMYGLFSDDIRDTLKEIDAQTSSIVVRGARLTRYQSVPDPSISDIPVEFLDKVHAETRDVSTENLITFSKNTPIFNNTAWRELADFNDENIDPL